MDSLPTLPQRTWLERFTAAVSGILVVLNGLSLAGWCANVRILLQPGANFAPVRFNAACSFLILSVALFALVRGWRRVAWIATIPTAIGFLTLLEIATGWELHIDEFFATDLISEDIDHPGRMPALVAAGILLAGLTIVRRVIPRKSDSRGFSEGVAGSFLASAGFSTLLGYATGLRAIYSWGTGEAVPPVSAIGLLLIGLVLILLGWRESARRASGPPAWSPLLAIIACLNLTLVLWIGLREREVSYLSAKTQNSMDALATAISYAVDSETNQIERMARRWGDGQPDAPLVWETDAKTEMDAAAAVGCVEIGLLDPSGHARWIYPGAVRPEQLDFDHRMIRERREALDQASLRNGTEVSATTPVTLPNGARAKGFVIYAPVTRAGRPAGFVSAEFIYSTFFGKIIARQPAVAGDYRVNVAVGAEPVYDSNPAAAGDDGAPPVEKSYSIFNRRIRLAFTSSTGALVRDRRLLPELALLAGLGITGLLGLSTHLWRSARAGQRAAELSNRKLLAENEERRRIEGRLKVSDERLRLALDSTQIGIFEWSVPAGHVYYSSGLWAMLGYDHARMPSTVEAWQSLIHPDDLPPYRRRIESQLSGIASFIEPEYRVRSRSGEWRWVYTRSKSVASGPNGRPIRIIGTVQDVTARRGAEQALRESQAETRKLSLVASKTDNPVLICSRDGKIEWVNEAFCRVMEYSLEEVVGRDPEHFMIGPDTDRRAAREIQTALTKGLGISTDVVNHSKSGRKYYLHLEIQPVHGAGGALENYIAIETDVTARVETENQLRRAKTEADAASRAKSEFLASMSHEIRTPMNGVIGMTSLLLETPLATEQRDFVNTIRNSGEALLTIINDILDFSKIESGKMELENIPLDLALCIEEALDLFTLQASAKKLEIAYAIAPEVPAWIVSDVTRLRQVIVNLVNNAIKFTPSGSVSLTVRRANQPAPGRPCDLEFSIRDTGIGIAPDRVNRLFKAFSQVDSSTTRKYGGTGLGLAICQRLAQLMGGDVEVESTVGEGSIFRFNILADAAPTPPEAKLPEIPPTLRNGYVICVDDFSVTQSRLRAFFSAWGATFHAVSSVQEAETLLTRLPGAPALLVLDREIPRDSLPRLNAGKCPRVIMLPFGQTASFSVLDGIPTVTVAKPLKNSVLLQAVMTLFHPLGTAAAAKPIAIDRPLADEFPLDILLAEDNAVNQKVALRFLERLGYRADAVGNGLEAVTTLENRRYDLVLMDLQMPEMDGLEASREIRRRFSPDRQPKIIALTANAMQGDREQCLAAGMNDYISKPVKMPEIAAAIRRQFSKAAVAADSSDRLL